MCIPKTKSVYPVLVWIHSISRSGTTFSNGVNPPRIRPLWFLPRHAGCCLTIARLRQPGGRAGLAFRITRSQGSGIGRYVAPDVPATTLPSKTFPVNVRECSARATETAVPQPLFLEVHRPCKTIAAPRWPRGAATMRMQPETAQNGQQNTPAARKWPSWAQTKCHPKMAKMFKT